jgi:ribonuclease D
VQLSRGDGTADVVQILKGGEKPANLIRLLTDPSVLKLFHFARFDVAVLRQAFGVVTGPVYCTKIASKLTRTYTDRHGLKDLVRELLGIELSKQQQSSDWAADTLSEAQLTYAASDVLHLHALHGKLDAMLAREGRTELAQACFGFLPHRAELDLAGWARDRYLRAYLTNSKPSCVSLSGAKHGRARGARCCQAGDTKKPLATAIARGMTVAMTSNDWPLGRPRRRRTGWLPSGGAPAHAAGAPVCARDSRSPRSSLVLGLVVAPFLNPLRGLANVSLGSVGITEWQGQDGDAQAVGLPQGQPAL